MILHDFVTKNRSIVRSRSVLIFFHNVNIFESNQIHKIYIHISNVFRSSSTYIMNRIIREMQYNVLFDEKNGRIIISLVTYTYIIDYLF